jgi:FAD/FMN-containing dehydrogenase
LGDIFAGMLVHPMADARDVLRFYGDYSSAAPDEVTVYAFLAAMPDIGPVVILMAGYFGDDLAAGTELLAPLRGFGSPLLDTIQPMSYPDFLALLDPLAPDGRNYYEPAYSIRQFDDRALDTLIAWAGRMTSPFSGILIHHIHGAAARVAPDATAFALREPHYAVIHAAAWEDGPAEEHIEWGRASFEAMQPYAMEGVYINFLLDGTERTIRDSYRDNYTRLAAVKQQYDPHNLFRLNQNIRPEG